MHRSWSCSLSLCLAVGAFLSVGIAPARAELVILVDGNVMKATDFEAVGEQARVTLASGGRITLPIDRIDRVLDDEYTPPPPPPPVTALAAVEAAKPPLLLKFEESQKVPDGPYGKMIYEAARRHSFNPQVVAALIGAESAGNPRAYSRKGARGLMQLMPSTAQRFGARLEKIYEPKENLEAGISYLSWLAEQFPNDLSKVLAAYNAGENAVVRYGGIPPYRETRDYVKRIYTTLGLTIGKM
jgi:hypothetical protein